MRRVIRTITIAAVAVCLSVAGGSPTAARCRTADATGPRTLVLALDGMPLRVVARAREQGAFKDWPATIALVSTFPSITNVAFTAMLQPFDVDRARGYEVQHFDLEQNEVVGGKAGSYNDQTYAWRELFDVTGKTFGSKIAGYVTPKKKLWKELSEGKVALFELSRDLILVHGEAADALSHLRGDASLLEFMLELDEWLVELEREHVEQFGRPLRLVLLSDHGNTREKLHRLSGIKTALRKADLQVVEQLVGRDDVIASTFGLVSYGALFLRPDRAEIAANAVANVEGVDLAAWIAGDGELSVLSKKGKATILWSGDPGARRLAYHPLDADPLELSGVLDRLAARSLLDDQGFAGEDDWFTESALEAYPDAPRRLIDALTGSFVKNVATVVFSVSPGYAWGWRSGHASSRLAGGRVEGTHGGLDRESSLGFFLSNDASILPNDVAVPTDRSLAALAEFTDCLAPNVPESGFEVESDVEPDGSHQRQSVAAANDARP